MSTDYYPPPPGGPIDPDQPTTYDPAFRGAGLPASAPVFSPPPTVNVNTPRGGGRRLLLIIGAVVAVLLILGGVSLFALTGAGGIKLSSTAPSAKDAIGTYCSAVKSQDYAKAYTTFGNSLQQTLPKDAYIAAAQALDPDLGKVTDCAFSKETLSQNNTVAAATVTFGRQKATKQNIIFTLKKDGTSFKFSQVPEVELIPFATVYGFCGSLKAGQLDTAYALLSPNLQKQVGTAANFQSQLQSLSQLVGNVAGCRLQHVALAGSGATVQLGMDFDRLQNAPTKMTLVPGTTAGTDLIDAITFSVVGFDVSFPLPLQLPTAPGK